MKITKATKNDKKEALKIASDLKDWFNEEGLKNMKIDFELNSVVVAKEDKKVLGFLCYTSYCGKMLLMWMGIKKEKQRKGIGQQLLKWLENESKKLGFTSIEVETLPDEDDYEPYKRTRSFYYKNGFERILYKKARVEGWDDQIVLEKKI
ncbi:MAG: N-acetyltransferase [Candidatus Magasanikbacteria bacterium CG_4_10_14_0_2_um_filter_33_14]|uniref:N-acetyltransferase n=1 Tax=Candidatus Magasanikbacteria bacterium CG_4_10_14_0_2_um_filter_33_14 TaxID=1974636 RepID=A0A2M7VB06_9BACT|nr:MAG: N-acetyltransferase [Candidatus Magasanikbacteria bacterium CG_4_10_14_0_2_um_filter_33_14]